MFGEGTTVAAGWDRLNVRNKATLPRAATATAARATHFQTLGEDVAATKGAAGGNEVTGGAGRASPNGLASLSAGRAAAGATFSISPARGNARSAFTEAWSCPR